jgi:hypothetical protein
MSAIMVLPHGHGHRRRSQRRLQAFGLVLGMPKGIIAASFGMSVDSSRIKLHHFPGRCERSCILAQLLHFGTKGYLAAELQYPLLGVKRTSHEHAPMSAYDPKRTSPTLALSTRAFGFNGLWLADRWAKQQAAILLSNGSSLFLMLRICQ